MANGVRINNLNQATSLNDTDTITIIQDDENKKAFISLLDKDGTYTQSVVNTIPNLITTSKANVETTKQAIDEKFGYDEFSSQIVTSQSMSSVGVGDDGSVDVSSQVQDGFMESAILYGKTQYHDTTADVYYDSMPEDTAGMTLELVSVKMPILTTTGKNLWDKKNFVNGVIDGESIRVTAGDLDDTKFYYDFKENQQYVFTLTSYSENKKLVYFRYNYTDGTNSGFTNFLSYNGEEKQFISSANKTILYISFVFSDHDNYTLSNVQLEEGSTATAYEPYKTSILSCNEEVELRGIGDVKDTLDLMTGELTERIGEIVLDGSEEWTPYPGYVGEGNSSFVATIPSLNNKHDDNVNSMISDKFISSSWMDYAHNQNIETVWSNNPNQFGIRVKSEKASDVAGIKAFLSANNIKINYKLDIPVIKTVDLNSSNGDVKTPVIYKNGHILLQSYDLIPELRYSIPVSYSGLIAQNTMTNLKHSWRLDELEIMSYTSIINSQYESLILVATAEANEVVVSSDYVPDESLYNMLKVLVNANALKNSNEKINVFYLYGKLSDEMYIDLIMGDDM